MKLRESLKPTPYGVHCCGDLFHACNDGEIIYLTEDEYKKQMWDADSRWRCPRCGHEAWWDGKNYDNKIAQTVT